MLTKPDVIDPERDFAAPEDKAIAVGITMTGAGGAIVLQTYIERDAETRVYNEVLDKLDAAIKRQEMKSQLEEHQANLEVEEKTLKNLKEDIVSVDQRSRDAWNSRKSGAYKRSAQEENQRATALTNVTRYEEAIAKRRISIAKLTRTISGDKGEPPTQDY